jgi:6-phosphogluconolactonase
MNLRRRLHCLIMAASSIGIVAPSVAPSMAQAAPTSGWIGTYTQQAGKDTGSNGIYAFQWDGATGTLDKLTLALAVSNPSWLVLHPNGRFLYSVNEDVASTGDRVSAYAIDARDPAKLSLLGSVASQGIEPCHVSIDQRGRWLFVTNYTSAIIAVFPIQSDGRLGEVVQTVHEEGSGPVASRQQSAHVHQLVQSPDGRFMLSVDLGADKIFVYRLDRNTGKLTLNEPSSLALPAGFGPRHLIFSKDGKRVYVLTELEPAIVTLNWNAKSGALTQLGLQKTLPADYQGRKSAAEITLHPNGRFLYVSHRGASNSIASFRLDGNGLPQASGLTPTGGMSPRYFTIDPTGRYLLAGNQASGNVVVLTIDQQSGTLKPQPFKLEVPAPVMILFKP